jgi:hypothetical protein
MARILTCGWGSQSLTLEPPTTSSSPVVSSGDSTAAIDTGTSRYSGGSVKFTANTSGTAYLQYIYAASAVDNYVRVYVKFTSFPSSGSGQILSLQSSSTDRANLSITSTGVLVLKSGSTQRGADSPALSLGVWYGIEIRNTFTGDSSCAARVWTDSYSSLTEFASGAVAANGTRIRIGTINTAPGLVFHATDLAINTTSGSAETSYPGIGRVVYMMPNAAGDNNEWQTSSGGAGSATNYQAVDEFPAIDDATTYLKRTSSAAPTDFYNLASATSFGIASSDNIKFVSVLGRVGASSGTANADRTVKYSLKSQSSGTLATSSSVPCNSTSWITGFVGTEKTDPHVVYLNPQDSSAWTASAIDTMQIGIIAGTTSTTEIRCSAMWAVVEFYPPPAVTVAQTLTTEWDTEVQVLQTVGSEWDVRQSVLDSLVGTWNTYVNASDTLSATWDTLLQVNDTFSTSWDVASDLTSVVDTFGATWDVRHTVNDSAFYSWDTGQATQDTFTATWDVLSPVTPSGLIASWDVAAPTVYAYLPALWNVYPPSVYKYLETEWDTLDHLGKTSAVLVSPNRQVIPTVRPVFKVIIASDWNGWELFGDLQVSTDQYFDTEEPWSPVRFSPSYTESSVITEVRSGGELLDNTTYYWRVRSIYGDMIGDWSSAATFSINSGYGTGAQYGFFSDVTSDSLTPVIWFIYPDTVEPGDQITIYGTGMSSVKVWYGVTDIVPDSITLVPGTADAFTDDRVIDAANAHVDVEHYEVVFTVPDQDDVQYGTTVSVEAV